MKKIFTILSIIVVFFSSSVYGEEVEYIEDDMELVYQADQAFKSKKYDEAINLFKKSLKVREDIYGKENDLTLQKYEGLSMAYFNLKNYKNAIFYTEKSLAIKEKKFGIKHLSTAWSYHNLGIFYFKNQQYQKAVNYLKKAIKIRENLLGKKHKSTLWSYENLIKVYNQEVVLCYEKGAYNEALNKAKKSLAIREKMLSKSHPDLAQSYSNISVIYNNMGEYSKALTEAKKALNIRENILSKNHPDLATSYNNISLIYQDMGEYFKALTIAKKALVIREKVLSKNHPSLVSSYSNISTIHQDMGEYSKALNMAEKALDIGKEILPKNHPNLARYYNNISVIYQSIGEYSKALNMAKKALSINKKVPKKHSNLAKDYNNISAIYQAMKKYSEALDMAKKALVIREEVLSKNHPDLAQSYSNISAIYQAMEKYSKALDMAKKALLIRKKVLSKNHPDLAQSYNNISTIYYNIGMFIKAYTYSRKSFNIFLNNRDTNFLILNSKEKEKYLKHDNYFYNFYNLSIDYIRKLQKKKDKEKLEKILIEVTNTLLNYKGSILDSENMIDTLYATTNDKELKEQIEEWKSKKMALAKLFQTVPKENKKAQREKRIKELQKEIIRLNYNFSKKALKFKKEENLSKISIIDIQSNLEENELYFDIFNLKNQYYTFVLDRERVEFRKYDNNESKQINTLIKSFRTDIKTILDIKGKLKEKKLKNLNETSKEKLSKLYDLIITKDIKERLKDKKQIIISADGLLRLLPFEALYDKNSSQYFIEQKEIRYVPSGKELVRLYKYRQYETTDNNQSIIFANPKFDANITSKNRSSNVDLRVSDLGILYMQFGNLIGTKKEAKTVKKILGENSVTEFQELKATEDNFMKTHRPPILHIATHGFFINSPKIFNPMLKSGIALSGANISAKEGRSDGIITALKLSGLNLRGTDLVVLSACNTGVVDVNSTESVSSLSKAFIQAGAKDVVMSLWSVDDWATKNLMSFFYKNIKIEKSYAKALREAKIRMIKEGDPIFHWAGFVVNGL